MKRPSLLKHSRLAILLALGAIWSQAVSMQADVARSAELESKFREPSDDVKPWAYWWWVNGNVTKTSITRDLEEMKAKGFGGMLMFDARGYWDDHVPAPKSPIEFMDPEWRKMLAHAAAEANRLGLKMSINLSSCAGALKGPWDVGNDAPKVLQWTSCELQGPTRIDCRLPRPKDIAFWDIGVIAVRHDVQSSGDDSAKASSKGSDKFSETWNRVKPLSGQSPVVTEIVDISSKIDPQGQLVWDAPTGRWTVLYFGYRLMEKHEYDVDVLDANAVKGHFERMGKTILQDIGPEGRKALTHFYSVSWEGAIPSWSVIFEQSFQKYRGYDLRLHLPTLAGIVVKNREESERFLRDYHRTLSDCFRDNFYGQLRELCHREGIQWHSESGGPWPRTEPTFMDADQLAFLGRNDMPQGEFWSPNGPKMNRPPAMASHIYGRPLAAVEAFTHMVRHWSMYPALLKPDADIAFCDGVNQLIWHTFTASPAEFGKPGIEYFAGTHLNPNVTWWEQSGPFLTYLARCQSMLRQGRFSADVCCYTSDKTYMHWGRGEKWRDKPSLTLPSGFTYDLLNTEVLTERLSVDNGDLVLPDGMRYRLLVVDLEDAGIPPQALRKIVDLAKGGATVVLGRKRPERSTSLCESVKQDDEVRQLAKTLWGEPTDEAQHRPLGKGRVIRNVGLDEVLQTMRILPDFAGPPWNYTHRHVDGSDIYFLRGDGNAECIFRTNDKEPEIWDPVTGSIRDAIQWRATDDGRTVVPISLPKNGSIFVVFRKPARSEHLLSVRGPENGLEIEGRRGDVGRVRLWRRGSYVFKTSSNREHSLETDAIAEPVVLAGPWQVCFAPGWGAPEATVFDRLIAWNTHTNEAIRHFSGTATYKKTFDLTDSQAGGLVRLQLGEVKNIANVRVNGKPLGIVWTAPWAVDLTGAIKPGTNELEIDVTNTWVNRLIGDAGLPPEKRLTKTNVLLQAGSRDPKKFPAWKGYASEDPLQSSGLLGPVQIEFGQEQSLPF